MQNAGRLRLSYPKLIHSFLKPKSFIIRCAQLLHFMLFLLTKIVFYGAQKLKGKRVFRKIEIIHVQHIVSSVAQ